MIEAKKVIVARKETTRSKMSCESMPCSSSSFSATPMVAAPMISPWRTRHRTRCPPGSRLLQDLGFLAFTLPQVAILMPTKKPRGQELTLEQQLANQALHHRRLRIEHVNSRVKRCRVVKDRIRL